MHSHPTVWPRELMLLFVQAQSGLLDPGVPVHERLYKRHAKVALTAPPAHLQLTSIWHAVSRAKPWTDPHDEPKAHLFSSPPSIVSSLDGPGCEAATQTARGGGGSPGVGRISALIILYRACICSPSSPRHTPWVWLKCRRCADSHARTSRLAPLVQGYNAHRVRPCAVPPCLPTALAAHAERRTREG